METIQVQNPSEDSFSIIRAHMIWATAAGMIPLPLVDIIAVSAIQQDMVKQLAKFYDRDFSESSGKALISSLAGGTIAFIAADAIKAIPGVGSLIGGVTMAILSGASTFAVGKVFEKHFQEGGSLFDFNADAYKSFYQDQFKKGKEEAKKARKSKDFGNLKYQMNELTQLRESGMISEGEYERMRNELLS